MRQEGLAPDPGCEWDKGGGFTKRGPGDSQMHSPGSCFLSVSCGPISGHRVAARGKWRWTGATPPFCRPVRARGCCAIHICAAPPGGVAPVSIIPSGKARDDTLTGKMGCRSIPDIHNNKERLEALRKQAVEKLRGRRAYRCPRCGCQSYEKDFDRTRRRDTYQLKSPSSERRGPVFEPPHRVENQRFPTGCVVLLTPQSAPPTKESRLPAGSRPRPREGPVLMGRDKQERVKKSPAW